MKIIIAAVAVASVAALGSPAFGATKNKQARVKTEPRTEPMIWQAPSGMENQYRWGKRARSPHPQWDVYRPDGSYAGSDPDPSIRTRLYFDDPTNGDN